ncbi:UDP-N-acetylglucosamine 2-epimerase [Bacteroides sp.]|uniref:UDP-N-acetylglucosamine 2-epimerase n=1 Tax=Bacteroides sp. TaxID=29523 RepID=UPI0025C4B6FC|nr:UDP-N-acetylglucosamine 2-epimerase [Bacteroides sp.]
MKIGFLTGARSEYGVMHQLIQCISEDSFFTPVIYATGMHFQQKYGLTINELKADNFAPIVEMPCYTEEQRNKKDDFVALIDAISAGLSSNRPDILYLIGDRLEAYAGALAAHFWGIPIAHFSGGQITKGAVDNIYRYNISNLSSVHFVTNKYAYERLQQMPIIENNTVHLVGSSAVDNIVNYLKSPRELTDLDPRLERGSFVLMTYHSQTVGLFDVPAAMDLSIRTIIEKGKRVLVTYPNNDDGSEAILDIINKWRDYEQVIVIPNLGAKNYHTAINNCLFVIGNSSSGVIEVPYFDKFTVNVGQRQSGRNAPKSVINTEADIDLLKSTICDIIDQKIQVPQQEHIYGRGNSIAEIIRVLKSINL